MSPTGNTRGGGESIGHIMARIIEPIKECPCIACNRPWHAGRGCSCSDCCSEIHEWRRRRATNRDISPGASEWPLRPFPPSDDT